MQFETIRQDGNLVGYLAFNQLEKSGADSFHYRIVIMDENLNDIGKVDFNEGKLRPQSPSPSNRMSSAWPISKVTLSAKSFAPPGN